MIRICPLNGLMLAVFLLTGGCQPAPTESTSAPIPATKLKEYWDAIYFGDSKVGYAHTVYAAEHQAGRQLARITSESEISIQRFGQETRQRLRYNSLETMDGKVIRFESSMSSGDSQAGQISMDAVGEARDGEILLRLTTLGKSQTSTIPWNQEWGGYFGMDQTLERAPLQPGDKRTVHALVPGFNQTAEIELVAERFESVDTLDGNRELLRIPSKILLGQTTLEQVIWTDRAGQTIKTFMPTLNQVTYRTTKERALEPGGGEFDLGEKTIVKLDREIQQPHQTRKAVYRATLSSGDPQRAFASGATQLVLPVDPHTVEIVVRALRGDDELGSEFPADSPTAPDDLASNSLIQCDDEQVAAMAREVATASTNPWEIAVALEQHVRRSITDKNFSQALSSAADVARVREGDCTEHAVLLAALCRARGIPAQVCIGLVYHAPSRGFAYHMWTRVWIKDRWIPLDGTLGLGGIGAFHIEVSHSNLNGVDPLTQFLPVLKLIGNLKLELVSVE